MHRSAVYLGDLLQALQATGAWQPGMPFPDSGQAMADFAAACGFEAPILVPKRDEELPSPPEDQAKPPPPEILPPPRPVSKDGKPAGERRLEFWHIAEKHHASAEELASRRKTPDFIESAPEASNVDWEFEWQPSPGRGLLPWKRLWPFLKGVLGAQRRSLQLDVPRTVKKLALAIPLRRFPLRKRPAWQSRAVLLVDYRPALAPFWDDYDWLIRRLSAVRGELGLSVVRAQWVGGSLLDAKKKRRWQPPATGAETSILALGDLSQFHPEQAELEHWMRLGRQLTRRGLRPWALCPCPRERWSSAMSRAWSLACWDHGHRLPTGRGRRGLSAQPPLLTEQNEIQARHERQLLDLLRLASPALHVERGLLRDLRLLLPQAADAGTEYDAFQSAEFLGSESARQLIPRLQAALRRELMDTAKVPLPLFLSAIRLLLAHHWHSQAVFGAQEWDGILDTATLEHQAALEQAGLLHEGVREAIRLHWEKLAAGLLRQSYGEHQAAMRPFAAGLVATLQESGLTSDTTARRAKEIIWRLHHADAKRLAAWVRPESIEFMEPQQTLKAQALTLRDGLHLDNWLEEGSGVMGVIQGRRMTLGLSVEGEQPNQSFKAERDWAASTLLTEEELRRARRVTLDAGDQRLVLEKMYRPLWASRLYYDRRGLVADLDLQGEKRTLRWHLTSGAVTDSDRTLPQPVLVNIVSVIREIEARIRVITRTGGIRFLVEMRDVKNRPNGWIDHRALTVIVCELVENAVKYTPSKGRVDLIVQVNYDQLKITVRDTGIGIPAKNMENIFEPASRANANLKSFERGMGLVTVGKLTCAMGGKVELSSDGKGSGTTAYVTLPWPSTRDAAEAVYRKAKKEKEASSTGSVAGKTLPLQSQATGVWHAESKPTWANRLWADDHGIAADFRIGDVPFVLRWIPPGRFLMGSPEDEPGRSEDEGPQHWVTISKGFWMGETPVTQAQWRAVVLSSGKMDGNEEERGMVLALQSSPSHFKGPPDLPVESVSWEDSVLFCRLLDSLLPSGPGFHLPTEAQWEFACRAGEPKGPFHGPISLKGDVLSPDLEAYAWYGGNSGKDCVVSNPQDSSSWLGGNGSPSAGTHPVKTKLPNPHGLYDMLGNIWEWCSDEWDATAYSKRVGGSKDTQLDYTVGNAVRVMRGGSWYDLAKLCRAASRSRDHSAHSWDGRGFRLCAGLAPPEQIRRPLSPVPQMQEKGIVMLIEDEDSLRHVTRVILTRAGYTVVECDNGRNAIEVFEQLLSRGAPPDVVLLNLSLSDSLGGNEIAVEILRQDPKARIICTSGFASENEQRKLLERGFVGCLRKPYEAGELINIVTFAASMNKDNG